MCGRRHGPGTADRLSRILNAGKRELAICGTAPRSERGLRSAGAGPQGHRWTPGSDARVRPERAQGTHGELYLPTRRARSRRLKKGVDRSEPASQARRGKAFTDRLDRGNAIARGSLAFTARSNGVKMHGSSPLAIRRRSGPTSTARQESSVAGTPSPRQPSRSRS